MINLPGQTPSSTTYFHFLLFCSSQNCQTRQIHDKFPPNPLVFRAIRDQSRNNPSEMMSRQPQTQQEHRFKDFHDLSALVLNIIRSPPPPIDFSEQNPAAQRHRRSATPSFQQITPAGFASLLLGISLSLMLCGSLTFVIGFILMPWVLGLVICLYFVGVVSSISMIGKALLCWNSAPPSPRKDAAPWKLL